MTTNPPVNTDTTAIDIRRLRKNFGAVCALKDITLQIRDNEFFTLLGPSGCGKTTLLRIIAGFEEASGGEIFLYGEEIENRPPFARSVNTVFQNYALFPHMTVIDNILFGLRMLKVADADAKRRAHEVLALVRLSDLATRRPAQLSGGQQQRVALARALAPAPKVLLLDESLSALDLKLRQAMRVELKQIQRETGITFVFVTHDQEEALTMSDRIAVMSEGTLRQVGDAREIYEAPANRFVADFIGETNLLPGRIDATQTPPAFVIGGGHRLPLAADADTAGGDDAVISIRPERARLLTQAAPGALPGRVEWNSYIGATTETRVRLRDGPAFVVRAHAAADRPVGEEVFIQIEAGAARLLRD